MPTYRVGPARGRPVMGHTPHALVCEGCDEELELTIPVEHGQEKFTGLMLGGVLRLWPSAEKQVRQHEAICRKAQLSRGA